VVRFVVILRWVIKLVSENSDVLMHMTKVKTLTLEGSSVVLTKPGMLRDVIVTTTDSPVSLLWNDGLNKHVLLVVPANTIFSHGFVGGWRPWTGAKLELVKEKEVNGSCWVSVGYVPCNTMDYSVWRLE